MRISTLQFHRNSLNAILDQQAKLANTQVNISTGKKILQAADDPVGAIRIIRYKQEIIKML